MLLLMASAFGLAFLAYRLFSDARRQGRQRRWAKEIAQEFGQTADEAVVAEGNRHHPPEQAELPAVPHSTATLFEMPVRLGTAVVDSHSGGDEGFAGTPAAFEEQAFAAARESLNRIVGQSKALLVMPDVRRHERVDMAVRGVAAESGWLLQALNGLLRAREEREADTELCSVAGLLQSVDEEIRPLAADRRNICTFENAAGELWLLADAALLRACITHFVASACLALKDAHIAVRASRSADRKSVV